MSGSSFWQRLILPYLRFSRGERHGIIILFTIVNLAWMVPIWLPRKREALQAAELVLIDSARRLWEKDSAERKSRYRINENSSFRRTRMDEKPPAARLLYRPFDPNQADAQTWQAMGLSVRTAATIQKYLAAGGRFRKPDDLRRIYGLKEKDFLAIRQWIRLADSGAGKGERAGRSSGLGRSSDATRAPPLAQDINRMDSADWERLPGIGPVLARRIIRYREGLGGFGSISQLTEVYGLKDSLVDQLRPRLRISPGDSVLMINLNQASLDALDRHPYISRQLATLILSYRKQHGPFQHLDDLLAIPLVNPELLNKLRPYLLVN